MAPGNNISSVVLRVAWSLHSPQVLHCQGEFWNMVDDGCGVVFTAAPPLRCEEVEMYCPDCSLVCGPSFYPHPPAGPLLMFVVV